MTDNKKKSDADKNTQRKDESALIYSGMDLPPPNTLKKWHLFKTKQIQQEEKNIPPNEERKKYLSK